MAYCPNCGGEVESSDQFCRACGYALSGATNSSQDGGERRDSRPAEDLSNKELLERIAAKDAEKYPLVPVAEKALERWED